MTIPASCPQGAYPLLEPFAESVHQLLVRRQRTYRIAYAASITPDAAKGETIIVGTLTGNITVNNPTGAREGMWLRFDFTQDGGGGHTVSFGSSFLVNWTPSTTGGDRNTISFRFDGTNWVQMGAATGL